MIGGGREGGMIGGAKRENYWGNFREKHRDLSLILVDFICNFPYCCMTRLEETKASQNMHHCEKGGRGTPDAF